MQHNAEVGLFTRPSNLVSFNRVNLCVWVVKIKRFVKYTNFTMNVLIYEKFRKERTVK